MSQIAIKGNTTGSGTFTIESPATNTDRTLTLPDEAGTVLTSGGAIDVNASAPADSLNINSSGNVLVGTTDNLGKLVAEGAIVAKATADQSIVSMSHNGSTGVISCSYGSTGSYDPLIFATSDAERMRVTSDGDVFINTTSAVADSLAVFAVDGSVGFQSQGRPCLTVNRQVDDGNAIELKRGGNTVGKIQVTTTSTSYVTSSDYRLKENVVDMTGAIERVKSLPVHRFNFIADPDKTVDGFLAHEAQAVVPEAVAGDKDEVDAEGNPVYQGIDQSKLVPLLTGALQEAIARIETLEAEVATLKGASA